MSTFSFGTPKPQQAQQQQPSMFGTPTSFNFGQPTSVQQNTGALSGASNTGFNFGQTSNTLTTPLFSFGQSSAPPASTTSTFSFGQPQQQQQTSLFGQNTFGTTSTPFGGGSLLNQQKPGQFSFGNTQQTFGQPQQQQQQQAQQQLSSQIFTPKIFNDERDQVLGKFNRLLAYWGTGKLYYAQNTQPLEVSSTHQNNRFKSIGFAAISRLVDNQDADAENRIGFTIRVSGDENQMKQNLSQIETNLKNLFGAQFNVKIEITKSLPEGKMLLVVSVIDLMSNKKIHANQLVSYLNQPNVKQQLNTVFMNAFINLVPFDLPNKNDLEEYLANPPVGIDSLLWSQAKLENPDTKKFIPVPLIGFSSLNERFKIQEQETQQQKEHLKTISNDINLLERQVNLMRTKIVDCKRRNTLLNNRILKIMVWQEINRKRGYPIQAEEDQLRAKLELIQSELNAPNKYKGCLNELICRLRQIQSQHHQQQIKNLNINFSIEDDTLKQIESHLRQEQQGIEHLLSILKDDMKIIDEHLQSKNKDSKQ